MDIASVGQEVQPSLGGVNDLPNADARVTSSFNNNQPLVSSSRTSGSNSGTVNNAPELESSSIAGKDLFTQAQSMIYEIAKLQIERNESEKISRREDRKQVVQDQIDQSSKMREAASERKTAQLITGSLSIVGGALAMGIGITAASAAGRAASSASGAASVASKPGMLSAITSRLAPLVSNTGSALIIGQGITTLTDGLGQVSSAGAEHNAAIADADVRKHEAFETAHRSIVQDQDERIDQSMKILDKSLDQISRLTDQHAESQKNANRV
ncbi:hypothetical protein A9Q99_14685 [Gammaproteobacteria bacterium 45_16_T64]|nr:hypothetical protein A9Q99_14685 [Gammaproteobacteria bacterium 45_16_T64]